MNKLLWLSAFIVFMALIFYSCLCKDCGGNKLQPIVDNLPYTNNMIVKFSNNGIEITDTVKINYAVPSDQYNCHGKENPSECAGSLSIKIGNFFLRYEQGDYLGPSLSGPFCGFNRNYFIKMDCIDYTYNGEIIEACCYHIDTSGFLNQGQAYYDSINNFGEYYYDLYLSSDNRLLKYSIKKSGVIEEWTEVEYDK